MFVCFTMNVQILQNLDDSINYFREIIYEVRLRSSHPDYLQ